MRSHVGKRKRERRHLAAPQPFRRLDATRVQLLAHACPIGAHGTHASAQAPNRTRRLSGSLPVPPRSEGFAR
eukprot:11107480-Lingulodinium_polyedra.AAC.1